jgi:hypothetical protein
VIAVSIRIIKCKSSKIRVEVEMEVLSDGQGLTKGDRWVVYGRKPLPTDPPSQTPKPSHWPTEEDEEDEIGE